MLKRTNLLAAIVCAAIACVSSQARADEIDFQKIDQQMSGMGSKVATLKNVSSVVKAHHEEIGTQMIQRSSALEQFANTVYQNVNVLKNNPNNEQSLEWAIEYSERAKDAADDLESLLKQFRRFADREDNDQLEDAARNYARLADGVEDRMRRIHNELD